jgi:hypothetical protein
MKGLTYILKDEGCFWKNSCVGEISMACKGESQKLIV